MIGQAGRKGTGRVSVPFLSYIADDARGRTQAEGSTKGKAESDVVECGLDVVASGSCRGRSGELSDMACDAVFG